MVAQWAYVRVGSEFRMTKKLRHRQTLSRVNNYARANTEHTTSRAVCYRRGRMPTRSGELVVARPNVSKMYNLKRDVCGSSSSYRYSEGKKYTQSVDWFHTANNNFNSDGSIIFVQILIKSERPDVLKECQPVQNISNKLKDFFHET